MREMIRGLGERGTNVCNTVHEREEKGEDEVDDQDEDERRFIVEWDVRCSYCWCWKGRGRRGRTREEHETKEGEENQASNTRPPTAHRYSNPDTSTSQVRVGERVVE